MTRITTLVLLALSFILLAAPMASLALPGAPLSAATLENSRGRSTEVQKYGVTCNSYNRYALGCSGVREGVACGMCSNGVSNVNYLDQGGSLAPGLTYVAGPPNPICGLISFGTCEGGVCKNGTNSSNSCNSPGPIGPQP